MENAAITQTDYSEALKDILFDFIFKGGSTGMVYVGPEGLVRQADPDFLRIMGFPTDMEIVGMTIEEAFKIKGMIDPETGNKVNPDHVPGFVRSVLESKEERTSLRQVRTMDGRRVHMHSWFNGKGELLSLVRDVSEDLRQRQLLEKAVESANAGYWSLNFVKGKFTYSQSVLNRLTDKEVAKMRNEGLFAILHPGDQKQITREWQEVIAGLRPFDLTYRVETEKEGVMWQRSVGTLEECADGNVVGATAFVRDINHEVQQRNKLLEAQKLSNSKSDFLARMSHEIRTPLNAIIGMSDSLREEDLSEEVREVVEDIMLSADGLHGLLTETLDHAKLMSNRMNIHLEDEPIIDIVNTCLRLWNGKANNKGLKLSVNIDPATPEVLKLDSFRLQQCMNNLLSNAIKFTEEGRVDLIIKATRMNDREFLVIAVKDTGIGMTEAQSLQIFNPYVQADETISKRYGGTGLGMDITKQLTELMGGELRVKTALGEGTTFAMIIPQVETIDDIAAINRERKDRRAAKNTGRRAGDTQTSQQAAPAEPTVQEQPINESVQEKSTYQPVQAATSQDESESAGPMPQNEPAEANPKVSPQELSNQMNMKDSEGMWPATEAFSGLSVLCVEDTAVNQRVVKRLIGKKVSVLEFADNGVEALRALEVQHFDVILMDIHMPVMNGIEATMEIRESKKPWANVAIIALTADPDYQQKSICRNIGMNGTIAKPVRREDIFKAFDQVLDGQLRKAG